MARKMTLGTFLMCGLLYLFLVQYAGAAGTLEVVLQQSITDMTPVYVEGHDGDLNWIAGFSFDSNVSYNSAPVGTLSGTFLLTMPPMDLTSLFDEFAFDGALCLTGLGTCALTGCGMSMLASGQGDILISFAGKLDACTDNLTGIAGLSTGSAESNILSGAGESEFVLRIPIQ
ncbi:MAG: hypothetical protein JRI27_10360 [Deltaproteobacteria bacterium]|nr:hypothetical protein [Deltaproteobacteria bacterium]